jgi:hypothetical protein
LKIDSQQVQNLGTIKKVGVKIKETADDFTHPTHSSTPDSTGSPWPPHSC